VKAIGEHLRSAPMLIDGDAEELVDILRTGAERAGITVVSRASLTDPAHVAVLAIAKDGHRSSVLAATTALHDLGSALTKDAVRIAIIRSGRLKLAPARVQRLVADEVLFHVSAALTTDPALSSDRSFRQRLGNATLLAAGLRVLRLG
jgi:hypothetical protein